MTPQPPPAMASRWRRRALCTVMGEGRAEPAALASVSGGGAEIETRHRAALGSAVTLDHPEAGRIAARVAARSPGGLRLAFDRGEAAVAFALAALAADMSRSG